LRQGTDKPKVSFNLTPAQHTWGFEMRSLVAEDDATNRLLLKSFLSRYGECDVALNGKQAVEAVNTARQRSCAYDLVCMDLGMPELDGQLAIREIRKHESIDGALKATRIIVTTAHSDMESITTALLGRCDAYLVKPINIGKLSHELKKLGLVA
jgi:two-component system chemotaxis response regulator CheY